MGCGCGKRKVNRGFARSVRVSTTPQNNAAVQAKVYQSATIKAPQGPVTRKTV